MPAGHHQLRFEFEVTGRRTSPGVRVYPVAPSSTLAGGALECGRDSGSPVSPDYAPPFEFTGEIHSVTVEVSGELIKDTEAEMRQIMARQ